METVKNPAAAGARLDEFVPFFKALCNPTRAQIIDFLLRGERCVCEMTGPLDQSQPLVSHHLALLRDAGLVRMRSEGTRTYYSLDWGRFDSELRSFLDYVQRMHDSPTIPSSADEACATATKKQLRRSAS